MQFPLHLMNIAFDVLLSRQVENYPRIESFLPEPSEAETRLRSELDMFAIDNGLIQSTDFDSEQLFQDCLDAVDPANFSFELEL